MVVYRFGGNMESGPLVIARSARDEAIPGRASGDRFADAINDTGLVTASVSEAVPDSVAGGDCFLAALVAMTGPGVIPQ